MSAQTLSHRFSLPVGPGTQYSSNSFSGKPFGSWCTCSTSEPWDKALQLEGKSREGYRYCSIWDINLSTEQPEEAHTSQLQTSLPKQYLRGGSASSRPRGCVHIQPTWASPLCACPPAPLLSACAACCPCPAPPAGQVARDTQKGSEQQLKGGTHPASHLKGRERARTSPTTHCKWNAKAETEIQATSYPEGRNPPSPISH